MRKTTTTRVSERVTKRVKPPKPPADDGTEKHVEFDFKTDECFVVWRLLGSGGFTTTRVMLVAGTRPHDLTSDEWVDLAAETEGFKTTPSVIGYDLATVFVAKHGVEWIL